MMRGILLAFACAVAASAVLATVEEPVTLLGEGEGSPDGAALSKMASGATAKADLAMSKIKHAKELRAKARASLTAKGKPIPEILKAGALDAVSKRVAAAKASLVSKFGSSADAEKEAKAEAKRGSSGEKAAMAKDNEEADEARVKSSASGQKASMYKKSEKGTKKKLKAEKKAEGKKMDAMKKKMKIQKKMAEAKADKKVTELEVKMKEKAKEKMSAGAAESEADFNHRQIAQEAYNKQVMGYVMSWEKTHGGPQVAADAAGIKNDLEKFVDGYEQAHSKITNDVAVADTPTE